MYNPDKMKESIGRVMLIDGLNVDREKLAEQEKALARVLTRGEVTPWDKRTLQDAHEFLSKLHESLV